MKKWTGKKLQIVIQKNLQTAEVKPKAYTNEFKYKIICEANMSSFNDIDVAQKYGINKFLLSKWKNDANNIEDVVAQKHKRLLK